MPVGKRAIERISRGLKRYQEILIAARKRDVSESDTVVIVGDILSDVLGYEKYVEITTEFAIKGTHVDLAVKVANEIYFLVEVKAIGVELKDIHVRQAIDYGANQGIEWAILTNGAIWRIYKIEFKKPISHVLVAQIDLSAIDARSEDATEFFANLCKEGFAKSQMEEFYEQHQATNKHTIAVVLLSEHMLNQLRLGLRRIFPSVQVDTETLDLVLRNDVLKRELIEGEEADAAVALVKKATRAAAREKRRVAKMAVVKATAIVAATSSQATTDSAKNA
ncbi:MAG: type I restriction enzyme HsdR N-terminal domain-containing protein [Proteobacteria bacterium]|nr:type I restriction enzyme HsdR N-terminal domain-containing protein [Pseudomonadota bacterium]